MGDLTKTRISTSAHTLYLYTWTSNCTVTWRILLSHESLRLKIARYVSLIEWLHVTSQTLRNHFRVARVGWSMGRPASLTTVTSHTDDVSNTWEWNGDSKLGRPLSVRSSLTRQSTSRMWCSHSRSWQSSCWNCVHYSRANMAESTQGSEFSEERKYRELSFCGRSIGPL